MSLTPEQITESLIADIDALPRAARSRVEVRFEIPESTMSIILAAARGRRLSAFTYVKRAAYAMACFDLGLPVLDALQRDPTVARENGFSVSDPGGVKFGQWQIAALEDRNGA
jgi:hypothetical protein